MLKAKALCAVNGNVAPDIRPLISVVENPLSVVDVHSKDLHKLFNGLQNIVIESVGDDEKIPEAVGQLAIRLMKNNCNGVQREHNKKLNNGLPILHKVPPKRDYGRYFCILAEKGGTSHGA